VIAPGAVRALAVRPLSLSLSLSPALSKTRPRPFSLVVVGSLLGLSLRIHFISLLLLLGMSRAEFSWAVFKNSFHS
jgi:hypothetical protein